MKEASRVNDDEEELSPKVILDLTARQSDVLPLTRLVSDAALIKICEARQQDASMGIHFTTRTPKKRLTAFKKAIDGGHVTTWSYDSEGDFTHTVEQWKRKAWLRPKIHE